jgi:uncharacterized protein with PIN domain
MVTPIELSTFTRVLDRLKGAATYLWRLGTCIATLEERVTHLEEALKTAPAAACPYCGERAMRLRDQDLTVRGDRPKRWTEETWTCSKCNKEYIERVPV